MHNRSSGADLLTVQVFGPKPAGKLHSAKMVRSFGTTCQRGSGLRSLVKEVQDLDWPFTDLFCFTSGRMGGSMLGVIALGIPFAGWMITLVTVFS